MKKPVVKALSVTLCALLAGGGVGGIAYAAGNSAPTAGSAEVQPSAAVGTNVKDETVYVLANADGSVQRLIVSDWVKNTRGSGKLDDVTELTGIENVKGEEGYTLDGNGACVWDARGNDIYYQGDIQKELPVTVAVSYTLDGQSIAPADLAGKSGRVCIRFDYTNNQYEMVDIGGKQEKICVPFAMLTGMVLDNDTFSNVTVSNGKLINDGDRTVVVGLAFPGMQDSLSLDRDTLELPDYVEVTADVTGFQLETTVTVAANELFNDAASRSDGFNGLDELDGKLDELTDAMGQLMDGSSQLYDGLCTLLDKSRELTDGVDKLTAGAGQLKNGADSLSAGAGSLQSGAADLQSGAAGLQAGVTKLQDGAASLRQGLGTLSEKNDSLNGAAGQVFQSLLKNANTQLAAAQVQAPELTAENYAKVLDGVIAAAQGSPAAEQIGALKASLDSYNSFYQGLQSYTAGVAQSAAGAGELDAGIGQLKDGAGQLSAGAGQLKDGAGQLKSGADSLSGGAGELYGGLAAMQKSVPALVDGVSQLRDGSLELSDGLKEFNEQGVQKLVDAVDGDLAGLTDRVDALKAVSEGYKSFAGISPDMDGQVKFIWRTEAVEVQE